MAQFVKHSNNLTMADAPVFPAGVTIPTQLIIAPNYYALNGVTYDMRAEGLYHILNVGVSGGYFIVYQSDVPALMSALSWLCIYGKADEALTQAQKVDAMRSRKIALRCEIVTDTVLGLCATQNIQARKVRLLTAGTPTGWDDGHVIVEAKVGGQWRAFDIPLDASFRRGGIDLSLADMIGGGWDETVSIGPIDADNDPGANNTFHTGVYADMFTRTLEDRAAWRARVFQIPGIVHTDGLTYFYLPPGAEGRLSWVTAQNANYRVVDQATWTAMFYS